MQLSPLHIRGGQPLTGEMSVQPSKNAALPILVASLLSKEPITLHGIPRLSDVYTVLELAGHVGAQHTWIGHNSLTIHTPKLVCTEAPYELVSKMRASFIMMGALLGRAGEAKVSRPGGCAFGSRPVDQHVKAFRALGIDVNEENGNFHARCHQKPAGSFVFEVLTVGGTQNAILASVLGDDVVVLENASIDTDVVDLINFLNSLGADIRGGGTNTLEIHGVEQLGSGEYTVIPDRIESGTFMIAAAATRGKLKLTNLRPDHLRALTSKLREIGVEITEDGQTMTVDATVRPLKPTKVITQSYPGFPTDLQPQISALLATIPGTSTVEDPVYRDRTTHVSELQRMGADITVSGHSQIINGGKLSGTQVAAADLRAGAALFIAALAAEGETEIDGVEYLNRGYENLPERLRALGIDAHQDLAHAMDD